MGNTGLRSTSHVLVIEVPTSEMTIATMSIKVTIPDGLQVQSTYTCQLAIPDLPDKSRKGHIIPGLASHLLLSVVKLCNAGWILHQDRMHSKI